MKEMWTASAITFVFLLIVGLMLFVGSDKYQIFGIITMWISSTPLISAFFVQCVSIVFPEIFNY